MSPRLLMVLALLVTLSLLMQLLACVLYDNWWPALGVLVYVLIPMPYLFFGAGGGDGGYGGAMYMDEGGDCWQDAGKFLAGLSATGAVAIPCTLYHSGSIEQGALALSLCSTGLLGLAIVAYERGTAWFDDDYVSTFYY
ncbi:hypothetical protein PPROV_000428500 [Pycnococcus provasolii]|uniref:Vacuolar protein sorting 55 n=1 Tax=Pycnococcus provasolii TaxID=41880 RepID=A0A830HEW7_9CHLO|nr:hypothetical protein PPROV_000428500 [Pycnococcus provasolii]